MSKTPPNKKQTNKKQTKQYDLKLRISADDVKNISKIDFVLKNIISEIDEEDIFFLYEKLKKDKSYLKKMIRKLLNFKGLFK